MKKVITLLVALIFIVGGAGFYFGYQQGAEQYNEGFRAGFQAGHNEGLAVGYQEGKEEVRGNPYILNVAEPLDTSNFIQSGLISMWTIRFKSLIITDISDHTLTLVPFYGRKIGDKELKVIVGTATKIVKAVTVPVPGEEGSITTEDREIKFADLQVGNVVEVYALWQEHDNMEPCATIRVIADWGKLKVEELEKSEKAELLISWGAGLCGEIEKINGRILSLRREGEKLDVFIREDASVMFLVRSSDSMAEASFEDLQVGDSLSVEADFTEKRLEGKAIVVFPRH